jgi:hypothetical protein
LSSQTERLRMVQRLGEYRSVIFFYHILLKDVGKCFRKRRFPVTSDRRQAMMDC